MQTYTAFISLKTYDNLYYIGEFKKSVIKVHKDALLEYERLKQNELFSTIKRNNFSDSPLTILVLNVKSLSKHVDNIASDNRIINKFLTVLMQDHIQLFSKDNPSLTLKLLSEMAESLFWRVRKLCSNKRGLSRYEVARNLGYGWLWYSLYD